MPKMIKPHLCSCGETDPLKFPAKKKSLCGRCFYLKYKSVEAMSPEAKDRQRKQIKLWQQDNLVQFRCVSAKGRAAKRNMEFNLDVPYLEELHNLQDGRCYYSGMPFDNSSPTYSMSLERIDSSKGYVKGNVVWVSTIVNLMKNDLTLPEFLDVARKLVAYQDSL